LELFFILGIIVGVTILITGIAKLLKQPLIIGYIISGIILGPYFLHIITNSEPLSIFSQMGVAFLLFIVGLNLNPGIIKEVGKVSIITGVGQVLFTSIIGVIISLVIGFNFVESIYIAIALTFSSTIIIMKILSDKGDINSLYGKISIGFLIVQDLIAVIILLVVSATASSGSISVILINLFLKGVLLIVGLLLIGKYILPRFTGFFAKSQEFLLLFAVGWCLLISAIFHYSGLSVEIGALLAGFVLSLSPYKFELESKMRPLRDFFIVLFFIILGSQMIFLTVFENIWVIIIFSLFILIGNPLIVMVLMGILGYSKKNSFRAGLTVAQISEFSLILIALGIKVGHLGDDILSIVTAVGLITIAGSTYMMIYSDKIYPYLEKILSIFEKKVLIEKESSNSEEYGTILFGCHRSGHEIISKLQELKYKFLIVDYNPEVVSSLRKEGYNVKYGDASNLEVLNELDLRNVNLIISTIPHSETNSLLLKQIRSENKNAIIFMTAHNVNDASELYVLGANIVLIPEYLSGHTFSKTLTKYNENKSEFYWDIRQYKTYIDNLKTKYDAK